MKKILHGRILIHGFFEPFGINFKGLDGLFLGTRLFFKSILAWCAESYKSERENFAKRKHEMTVEDEDDFVG